MPFIKGKSGNEKGREKGSKNKLTRTFKEILTDALEALQEDKKNNLEAWAKENPTEFYKIASKLIPSEISATVESKVITVIPPNDNK
jgi:hypothetical protein